MAAEQFEHEEETLVQRLLAGLVAGVCRAPVLVLTVCFALAGLSAGAFLTRLEYHTQRNDLLSPDKDYQQRWNRYLAEFGSDDDMVVVVAGGTRERMQEALEAVASEVQKCPELFDRLFYKVDLRPFRERALLFLPVEEIQEIQANLQRMGLLLDFGPLSWQSLNLYTLLHEARVRAGKINPDQALSRADEQFLTQLLAISQSARAATGEPARYENPWQTLAAFSSQHTDLLGQPQYFFSGDGTLAFLLTRPVQEAGSFTAARSSVERLRLILSNLRARFTELEIGLTGLPVLETDEMLASQQDTAFASWVSLAGVTLLYLLVFRGFRYPFLTIVALLTGTIWAMGWLTLTVGHLNILSATFAMMLIGLGDYGVLWVTRYEEDRALGVDVPTALRNTACGVGPGILTAAITTALAFYAAMLADFRAVAELGWIAGSGVLLCAAACFTVMPALLTLWDRRERGAPMAIPIATASVWLPFLARRPRSVIAVSLGITGCLAVCALRVDYDHNLLHLQAEGLESVRWEMRLIEHTAGASWHALSYTASQEEALALKASYEKLPGVERVVEVASLVPPGQQTKLDNLREIQQRLRRLPERGTVITHALPNPTTLKTELSCLIGQLQPLVDASSQPLLHNLRRSLMGLRDGLNEMHADAAARRIKDFEQRLAGDLVEDLYRLREVSAPRPIVTADLPPELRERYMGKNGKWLLRIFAKGCLWDYGPLAEFVRQVKEVDPEATGKPFTTLEGLRLMRLGFLWAGVYALSAVVIVLLADFRDLRHTAVALMPLLMGVVLTLGLIGLFGVPLNPANMIAFPLILGVGVDNGVHVLHDFLGSRGERRAYNLSHTTGRGIAVAALTTILGFGSLMLSQHRGLVGLGLLLTLGVTCCMLSALVFLPAVLRVLSQQRLKRVVELPGERREKVA